MHAASRNALSASIEHLRELLDRADNVVVDAARVGTELFDCVGVLDDQRALRVALAEASAPPAARHKLVDTLFSGKISEATRDALAFAVTRTWSSPKQLVTGLVELGRRALLRAAAEDKVIDRVESELYQLSRILEKNPTLTSALIDRSAQPAAKRSLLASVIYGKVSAVTEALALQAISRRQVGPIADIAQLAELAADTRGRKIARVTAAAPLGPEQTRAMAAKLASIYGTDVDIHSEVDPLLLGGAIVRVGAEVIDGSTAGKIERMRQALA